MSDQPESLKLVLLDLTDPHVGREVERALAAASGHSELHAAFGNALFVNTTLEPADLRDRIGEFLHEGDSAIVVEFERWSGYGPIVDSAWLMRRGH